MAKLAVIVEGGALQAGFVTGAVTALNDKMPGFSLRNVDTFVAFSASVGNMFWYFSGRENHIGRKMWAEELTSSKFILPNPIWRLLRGEVVLDVDYLVDVIFKQRNPLSIERIAEAKENLYFPLLNCESGEVEFFTNDPDSGGYFMRGNKKVLTHHIPKDESLYELIRAAKALPFLYNKTVRIGGTRYIDGAVREPFALDIPCTKDAKKILIVSGEHGTIKEFFERCLTGAFLLLLCIMRRNGRLEWDTALGMFRKAFTYRRLMKDVRALQRKGELLLIQPEETLGGTFDNSSAAMKHNFETGEKQVLSIQREILSFVGGTIS